ncbi:MAG: arginine deiminase-related protein [Cyclobacteriaceae bacterium]|jgi:hypothetical protein|nr:arginine deiminase-related protein [Cytophagales bacterium]MCZ8327871.1 arginine deiminase-related protein [Cyclobacteriaceae bacterium]
MKIEQAPSTLFMVKPAAFGFNPETANSNSFQNNLVNPDSAKLAREEFSEMMKLLNDYKIEVIVFNDSPEPPKPDAVFPNNWLASMPDGKLILFPMLTSNRRWERNQDFVNHIKEKYYINEVIDYSHFENLNQIVEGTGSLVFDHPYKKVYAALSPRTDAKLAQHIAKELGYEAILFHAETEDRQPIYHTNVVMSIASHFVVICLDAIRNEAQQDMLLDAFGKTNRRVIAISYHQMVNFAGNLLEVKNKDGEYYVLLSQSAFDTLLPGQLDAMSKQADVIPIKIPTIEKIGGGSVRCMVGGIHVAKK